MHNTRPASSRVRVRVCTDTSWQGNMGDACTALVGTNFDNFCFVNSSPGSGGSVAGIVIACIAGVLCLVGLLRRAVKYYQKMKREARAVVK